MRRLAIMAAACGVAGCAGLGTPVANGPGQGGDAIETALTLDAGNASRGREIVLSRDTNCLLCHTVPAEASRAMGNLAPPLAGVGARLTAGQMRLRIVDSTRLNRETIMPPYHRAEGLNRVAANRLGSPILTAQQVEDTIAYLLTLR